MSTTITIDGNARAYDEAYDPAYKDQIDAGNTGVAKAPVSDGTALTGTGESVLLKSKNPAGSSGERAAVSVKDRIFLSDGSTDDFTGGVFLYYPLHHADSAARLKAILAGLFARIQASDYALVDELILGAIRKWT